MKRKHWVGLILLVLIAALCLIVYEYEKRLERPLFQHELREYLQFSTKEAYDSFWQNNDVPEHFIIYNRINSLGAFDHCNIYFSLDYLRRTYYYLSDQSRNMCCFMIIEWDEYAAREAFGYEDYPIYTYHKFPLLNTVFRLPDTNNMLVLPEKLEKDGFYVRCDNEIWYYYENENLKSVSWFYSDYRFIYIPTDGISADYSFSDYPDMDADTFTVKLLNVETAEQAIEELMRECFPDQEYTGLQRIKVPKFKN